MKRDVKIGIRDSGVGGLTVARRVREAIPSADLLYFADTAHVPYGDKTVEQIRHYALSISEFLIGQGAQIVVFACNTTSAYALEIARARFGVPVFGVIEPGARAAAQSSRGKVGVLATAATVASGVYSREIKLLGELDVLEVACPAFVPLVEAQKADSLEAYEACKHYMAPLLRFGADTVVLGCTHYPLLLPTLQEIAPEVNFVDPADFLAAEVAAYLGDVAPQPPDDMFWVSGPRDDVESWVQRLLDIESPRLKSGPVFDLMVGNVL
jgi:glutamate racemase